MAVFRLVVANRGPSLAAELAVRLADIVTMAHQKLLQFEPLGAREHAFVTRPGLHERLATAQTIADVCQPPAVPGVSDFTIDARNGDFEGRTRHGQRDVVRIVVVNKNPYLYEYRLAVESSPVPGPSPSDFLALFGLKFEAPDADAPKAAAEKADKTAKGAPPGAAAKPCPSAGALEDGTRSLIDALSLAVGIGVSGSVHRAIEDRKTKAAAESSPSIWNHL